MLYPPGARNYASERYKKMYDAQSADIQKQLDGIKQLDWKKHQLKKLKKSKIPPRNGDLFVFSPKKDVFFMGRVLEEKINHITNDSFINGESVVFLFRCKAKTMDRANFVIDYDNLLSGPMIVDPSYWTKGLFQTIGNEPITEDEKKMDYGFFDVSFRRFTKADGTVINYEPKYWGMYGLSTIIAVAMDYAKESIIDPSLA